jgi:hypothetical protein
MRSAILLRRLRNQASASILRPSLAPHFYVIADIARSHRRGHDEVAKPALQELCRVQPKIRSPGSASNMSSKQVSDREHYYQRGDIQKFSSERGDKPALRAQP